VPALIAYGIGLHYGAAYYVLMLLAVLGTPLLPAGLGALLVLLVARVAPARRVREVLALAAALFGSICALLGNTSSYWIRQIQPTFGGDALAAVLSALRGLADLPIPSLWAGRGLAMAGAGDLGGGLVFLAGFLLLTFGFFAGCTWLAERMYTSGWLRMQSAGEAKRKPRKAASSAENSAANRIFGGSVPPWAAIAFKDWRVIPRDLRNFAQFLSPLFLIPVVYVQLFLNTGGRSGQTLAQTIGALDVGVDFSNILLAGTVLMSTIFVFSRIAQTGVSMEGRSYWILKAAPLAGRDLLLGKFAAALAPFSVLSTLLLGTAALLRGFTPVGFLYGWFGVLLLGAGMLAMDVGLSVPWANLNWDDPRKMRSGWGGLIALVGYVVIGVLGGLSLALPYLAGKYLPFIAPVAWVLGPFLAIGFTGLVAGGALWLGLGRLGKVGE
jgi:ABC-2 type transport system permease protein